VSRQYLIEDYPLIQYKKNLRRRNCYSKDLWQCQGP